MEFLFGLGGVVAGIIGATIAWFFIAKNNTKKLLKLFSIVNGLPQDVKDALSKLPEEIKAELRKIKLPV